MWRRTTIVAVAALALGGFVVAPATAGQAIVEPPTITLHVDPIDDVEYIVDKTVRDVEDSDPQCYEYSVEPIVPADEYCTPVQDPLQPGDVCDYTGFVGCDG